jgi:tetratricopeptide (TPR) repeat protein
MSLPTSPATRRESPPARRVSMQFLWLMILVSLVPLVYLQFPREVSYWLLAAAEQARANGNAELATQRLQKAFSWNPDDPWLQVQEVQWLIQDEKYLEALKVSDVLAERFPQEADILQLRMSIFQHLERHEDAIAAARALDQMSLTSGRPDRAMALNNLAYARAVGNLDLEQALKEVNEALVIQPAHPSYLDTRGFILYLQGNYKAAHEDLDAAVKRMAKLQQGAAASPSAGLERYADSADAAQSFQQSLNTAIAVTLYHRALNLEKLGRFAEAKVDRARVKKLIGREPDATLF